MRRVGLIVFSAAGAVGLATVGDGRLSGQEKAAPAVRVAPAAPPAADNDAFIRQVEQRYAAQFRQLYRSELHFMRVVAEPTRPQYEKIAADAEPSIKAAVRAFAQVTRGVGRGQDDPRAPITEAIAKSVKANLSPDQAARYEKELDLRVAARKRLFVTNLVAMIDRVLILRPDQREKLDKILAENWDDSWQLQVLTSGGQYFPALPEAKIRPILSDAQQQVWQGIPKGNIRFGTLGFVQGIEIDDEVWDNDPPKKAGEKP